MPQQPLKPALANQLLPRTANIDKTGDTTPNPELHEVIARQLQVLNEFARESCSTAADLCREFIKLLGQLCNEIARRLPAPRLSHNMSTKCKYRALALLFIVPVLGLAYMIYSATRTPILCPKVDPEAETEIPPVQGLVPLHAAGPFTYICVDQAQQAIKNFTLFLYFQLNKRAIEAYYEQLDPKAIGMQSAADTYFGKLPGLNGHPLKKGGCTIMNPPVDPLFLTTLSIRVKENTNTSRDTNATGKATTGCRGTYYNPKAPADHGNQTLFRSSGNSVGLQQRRQEEQGALPPVRYYRT